MKQSMSGLWLIVAAVLLLSCGATKGEMFYTVDGSTITVHNTPDGGEKKLEMEFPTGSSGAKTTLYGTDGQGRMTGNDIVIEYDRSGVKSVTFKGREIPRK